MTIWNWECNESFPQVHKIPSIIRFLGYNPLPAFQTEGERLIAARKVRGITQKQMAKLLGINSTTLARWKRGNCQRLGKFWRVVVSKF